MARMHSRAKGKSGSHKPASDKPPVWITYSSQEVEALVVKLAKRGYQASQIGLILRDTYGIPDVKKITGKKISKILAEKGLKPKVPDDLANLIKRAKIIKAHMSRHKKDMVAKRGLQLTESKIKRLIKYYKSRGVLPENWTYTL